MRAPILLLASILSLGSARTAAETASADSSSSLWRHNNLVAWCVVPFDARKRGPEERAKMLQGLGFRHFAYDWREKDVPTFDAEIDAAHEFGIEILAWWFPLDAEDPMAMTILETFKRHNIHPQLWDPFFPPTMPMTAAQWVKVMPAGYHWPKTPEELARLSDKEKAEMKLQMGTALLQLRREDLTMTADGQVLRVDKEADRIRRLEELAKPYGCMVELYNHNGWLGMAENQLAVIEKLRQLGVNDVGMVYNFSHSRDELHDDSANFPALWRKIEFHVVNVNITGMHMDGDYIYPSQGNGELEMMRTIQESGWNGTVGLDAEKGLDAQITLQNYLRGLDWIAAELKQAGSAGPRPLFQPP